ncbi:hypothetical protein EV426DRAFT_646296 [Tirmania nivea]|nr:hypothetical protein EV426DRAFT_646296 [Tirmania nivea]
MVLGGPSMISRRVLLLVFIFVGAVILMSSKSVAKVPVFPEMPAKHPEVRLDQSSPQEALRIVVDLKATGKGPSLVSSKSKSIPEEKPHQEQHRISEITEKHIPTSTPTPLSTKVPHLPSPTKPPLKLTPTHDPSDLWPPPGHPLPQINPLSGPPPNSPPPPLTPLLIGFTRNYPILQQCILSYISSGWPPSQIYIIDNTGTMDSNRLGLLSPENPFYLPYAHMEKVFGVNVVATPTLLSFAQLQNFFINFASEHRWERFFWSHMDSVVLSYEDRFPYISLYNGVLELLSSLDHHSGDEDAEEWALKLFTYDRLALVHTSRVKSLGAWDTFIPYYYSDCDFYLRVYLSPYTIQHIDIGYIYDVGDLLPDLSLLFPNHPDYPELTSPDMDVNLTRWGILKSHLTSLDGFKNDSPRGRNYWQARQRGGKGEPFYKGMGWFESELKRLFSWGESVYVRKWGLVPGPGGGGGAGRCTEELIQEGKGLGDIWKGQDN